MLKGAPLHKPNLFQDGAGMAEKELREENIVVLESVPAGSTPAPVISEGMLVAQLKLDPVEIIPGTVFR